ncbi:MAG: hypothetical protein WBO76_02840, partial [Saprospiraceae bacterium]
TLIIEDTDPEEDDCEGNNDCPNVLYFFHPDHIGSSTFLTDEAGNPYQFILYLPFGDMTDWWRYCANRVIKITR